MNINELLERPINELSAEEMEAVLNHKRKMETEQQENEKRAYEAERDSDMGELIALALEVESKSCLLKKLTHAKMEKHQEKLNEYGKIRSNSKGGFTLMHSDKTIRIKRRRDTQPTWDERSTKALELIHAFLYDTVKKRDKDLFEMLIGFLVKNKKGDLDYASVMNLLSHETRFDDPRWKEGLRLLKQSYSNFLKGYQYDFEKQNEEGKFERIELNFSAL
ncbi:DUF3164 family protein [Chryseobacterium gambrini]|uniref:DUF3164 family protein n=1 Tax=Chryseobacterium gambrini TaxID=373672 RepID=A0A1N7QZK5_9FLAO|nr:MULTISPECIES: DUF3164 family protein [Chryseobacterium]MBL7878319.1 DUF3164 family protein [Chryseobacterium gambrini]MDN4015144.1 DUF3164 family protein [Chryseobacterium gambrini]MDN4028671.1 DUF3164 family protein [Chryseobacterium gambrini]QWA37286.1 DUF3164 family protein [Chryseobacterium sp. ZHDP1]QWA40042.1 DUF3164 family protein [Chryseobacterium sp. ZHDP1]